MINIMITIKYEWMFCQYDLLCTKTIGTIINITDFFQNRTKYKYDNYDYTDDTFNRDGLYNKSTCLLYCQTV